MQADEVKTGENSLKIAASRNIEIKLQILGHFVNNGIPWLRDESGNFLGDSNTGSKIIDVFPKSLIQFSLWTMDVNKHDGIVNCSFVKKELKIKFGEFTSHGQESLTKKNRPIEYAQAIQLLAAIKTVAIHQSKAENNSDLLLDQKNEIARWKAAAEAQATFVSRALEKVGEMEKQIEHHKRSLNEMALLTTEIIATKDRLIASKDAFIAVLTKEIHEIKRFSKIDGGQK